LTEILDHQLCDTLLCSIDYVVNILKLSSVEIINFGKTKVIDV